MYGAPGRECEEVRRGPRLDPRCPPEAKEEDPLVAPRLAGGAGEAEAGEAGGAGPGEAGALRQTPCVQASLEVGVPSGALEQRLLARRKPDFGSKEKSWFVTVGEVLYKNCVLLFRK